MNRIIWHEERITTISGLPPYHIVTVQGRLENNRVSVHLMMYGGSDVEIETFSSPLEVSLDSISIDRVSKQYSHRISDAKKLAVDEWLGWLKIYQYYLREQSGRQLYYDFVEHGWFENSSADLSESLPAPK